MTRGVDEQTVAPLTTVDCAGILVNWAGCAHVYAVEEQFDRDGDCMPDFLGVNGAVNDIVEGALAAIGPELFTAMYECFWKLVVLYHKLLLAKAKMNDTVKMLDYARKNPGAKMNNEFLLKTLLTKDKRSSPPAARPVRKLQRGARNLLLRSLIVLSFVAASCAEHAGNYACTTQAQCEYEGCNDLLCSSQCSVGWARPPEPGYLDFEVRCSTEGWTLFPPYGPASIAPLVMLDRNEWGDMDGIIDRAEIM
jgi:hypothetical protein